MKNLLILLVLLFFFACGTLPEDKTPAPINENLYTLELHYKDLVDVGILGTLYDNSDMEEYLSIPVWGKGLVEIVSNRCQFQQTQQYDVKGLSYLKFKIQDMTINKPHTEFACLFDIYVLPAGFDRGMKGQFHLLDKEEFEHPKVLFRHRTFEGIVWIQMREGSSVNSELEFQFGNRSGILFFDGCGRSDEITFSGNLRVPLSFFTGSSPKECDYEAGILYNDGGKATFTLNLKVFKNGVLPLEAPSISYVKNKVSVTTKVPVAFTGIDSVMKQGNKATLKVGENDQVLRWARSVTANGRYLLLGIKKGEVVWTPSWQY